MNTKRAHVVIPEHLVQEIDVLVGRRQRSSFFAQAAERELTRLRQLKALDRSAGTWKDTAHPELKAGAVDWVKALRQENERRSRK